MKVGPDYHSVWTEAGMYHALMEIIESDDDYFEKFHLDNLLKNATDF